MNATNKPDNASGMPLRPEYWARKKPPRKKGRNCGRPITLTVMAKPRAGSILPVADNALVIQTGRPFMKLPMASAPKYRPKNIGMPKRKNLKICGHQTAMNMMPLVLQVLAYSSAF